MSDCAENLDSGNDATRKKGSTTGDSNWLGHNRTVPTVWPLLCGEQDIVRLSANNQLGAEKVDLQEVEDHTNLMYE